MEKIYEEIKLQIAELELQKSFYRKQSEWCRLMYELRLKEELLEQLLNASDEG